MLIKPSRSEIEEALSGANTSDKRQPYVSQFETQNPLRQRQVIGGDIKGISERQKYGPWQRTLNRIDQASVINWLLGFMLLLAFIVFIWPQKTTPIKEDPKNKISEQERAIYTESRFDDQVLGTQENSFSRNDDLDRATAFRKRDAKDKKIRELTSEAEKLIADGWYTLPTENNALKKYQEVLDLDDRNTVALQGIDYISGRFLIAGIEALGNNNEIAARNALDKLVAIDPESLQRFRLVDEIDIWKKQQQIYKLIQQARFKLESDQLIQPARDNALYYFQQALALDKNNKVASVGINSIADKFVQKTKTAIFNQQLLEAKGYVETIRIIAPNNDNIERLEELIADASETSNTKDQNVADNSKDRANETAQNVEETVAIVEGLKSENTSAPKTSINASEGESSAGQISKTRTSKQQTSEQQAFDKQYLSRGLTAYDNGEYESSLALLKPLADKGVSRAQIRIANMIYAGDGIPQDIQNAYLLAEQALPAIQKFSDEGRTWAQTELANMLRLGLGVPRDTQQALRLYLDAGTKGYPQAQAALGLIYLRGEGVLANRRVATLWLQRAAKQGNKSAIKGLNKIGIMP